MKDKILSIILFADLLGQPVSLRINHQNVMRTYVGAVLSIMVVVAIGAIFIAFSLEAFCKLNPQVALETRVFNSRQPIVMNSTTMNIAFGVSDEATDYITKPEYFSFYGEAIYNLNSGSNYVVTPLNIRPCQTVDFPSIPSTMFYEISLNYMMCVENLNFTLYGHWNEPEVQTLSIKLALCKNETSNVVCAPLTEIEKFLKDDDYYFNIFFLDTSINMQNYSDPIKVYAMTKYQGLMPSIYKTMEIYLKNQEWRSDDSLLFSNNITGSSIAYDTMEYYDSDIGSDQIIFDCSFFASNRRDIHYRVYKKISEVLADVGGLGNVILFFFKMLCYFFARVQQDEQILNGIFDFDIDGKDDLKMRRNSEFQFNKKFLVHRLSECKGVKDDQNGNIKIIEAKEDSIRRQSIEILTLFKGDSKKNSVIPEVDQDDSIVEQERVTITKKNGSSPPTDPKEQVYRLPNFTPRASNTENSSDLPPDVINKIITLDEHNKKLEFSFCDIVKYLFCRCLIKPKKKRMFQLLSESQKALNEVLDICFIVRKLDEFEKLKLVLFSKEQIALFNFISKEVCTLEKEKKRSSTLSNFKHFQNDQVMLARTIINFIENLNQKEEDQIPEIDKKLFALLHGELKRNIEDHTQKSFLLMK